MRQDGRPNDQLRPISIRRGFTQTPAGSVLWQQGNTIVLCTAAVSVDVPPWFPPDRPGGWITCEYVMLPASTPQRKPWPKIGHTDSRGTEIQRLIGRVLRAAIDLERIGPHTIAIDCQVLQADGGTRTAAICGGYVALVDALRKLPAELPPPRNPADVTRFPARYDRSHYKPSEGIVAPLAAVSVGVIDGEERIDLDYHDDSRAEVDMNVAYTARGEFVEVQGAAENGGAFDRGRMNRLLDLAVAGCERLMALQRDALAKALEQS
jgi:ribonuclease PH